MGKGAWQKMTNVEKYLKDGVDEEEFINELHYFWWTNEYDVCESIRKFLHAQAKNEKPVLTEDERAILRHLKGFYYIYRASTGELEATNKEHTWCGYELYLDDDVFQFIKERRRISD